MFTVKLYDHDYDVMHMHECEGVRRQFLANGDVELAIQGKLGEAASWLFVRLRDMSSKSKIVRESWGANADQNWSGFYASAIVENAAGKTSESIYPKIARKQKAEGPPDLAMAA